MQPRHRPYLLRILAVVVVLAMMAPGTLATDGAPEDRGSRFYVEPGLEYVAIAPTHLARYLSPLIEWKMDRGVPSQIFDLESVLDSYEGRDGAERLHNFLQDLYHNETDGSPRWLLLAGDSDRVPVRYLWANRDHTGDTTKEVNLYVGDTYYSGLDGDWDADGDGVFGEPGEEDPTPELYVGRIPASLPEELEAAVSKTLAYELDPPGGEWFENVLLAGALMDEPNRLDDPYTLPGTSGQSDEGYDPHTDNAWEATQRVRAVLGGGYDYVDLADYPFFEGCNYSYRVDNLSRESARAGWLRGNSMVFMASHGYEAFGGLAEYQGTGTSNLFESAAPFITWEDTRDNSTGGMLPLVYISSCYAGQFDMADNTNFETALTVPEGGAIGLVAGDGDTFRMENISARSFGNWWLSERFWQLVALEGANRPGQALYELKREYHDYYMTEGPPPEDTVNMDYFYSNLYAYNLLGDPEVPVWLGPPSRLSLEVLGGAVVNAPSIRVRVTDEATGEAVAGAAVHARGAGLPSHAEATTGPDGTAVILASPTVLDAELRLAAVRAGSVPDRTVMAVGAGIRDLALGGEAVTGPGDAEFTGGVLAFNATVRNAGDYTASGVVVRFDSGDPAAPDEEGVHGAYQTRVVDLGPGESATLEFGHVYTGPGQYELVFEVDPEGRFTEASELNNRVVRQLLLRPLPTLPDSIGPIQVVAGQVHPWPVDLDFYVELPNGFPRTVSFSLGEVTKGVGAWVDDDNNLMMRPEADVLGTASIVVLMSTDGHASDRMTVLLDVQRENRAPVIGAIPDQTATTGSEWSLELDVEDPHGDPVLLTVTIEDASIRSGTVTWTPGPGDVGTLFPTVRATDQDGATTEMTFQLEVRRSNSPPMLEGPDGELVVDGEERVQLPVRAHDAEGDPVSFALAGGAEGFSIDGATGLLTFDARGLGPGDYSAVVVASDGLESSQRTLTVTVEGPGTIPALALLVAGVALLSGLGAALLFRPEKG